MDRANPKILPGGRGRIPFLLRAAFQAADAGDREEALGIWAQAIAEGYLPRRHTKSELMYKIRMSEEANADFAAKLLPDLQSGSNEDRRCPRNEPRSS